MFWTVSNGELVKHYPQSIMVANQTELNALDTTGIEPGTLAYTAGYANMWQLDSDGAWQTIVEEAANV